MGWRHATAIMPYTDLWKTHRRNITKIASTNTSLSTFDSAQEAEAAHFLGNLLEKPEGLFDHIRKEAGSVILKITYGYNTEPRGEDPFVNLASKTMAEFADATVPGRYAVDLFPFRKSALLVAKIFSDLFQSDTCQTGCRVLGLSRLQRQWLLS